MPLCISHRSPDPPLFKLPFDSLKAFSLRIHIINQPYRLRLVFIYYIVAPVPVVAEHISASIDDAFFHGCLLAVFYTNRCFPALILGKRGHNGKPQFTIRVKCLNPVTDEIDLNHVPLQLPCIVQRIDCVPRKS